MQYCDSGDLGAEVARSKGVRHVKENKVLHWFVQCALGLHFMHENHVMHRDLKGTIGVPTPALAKTLLCLGQNIFLLSTGRVVLGDLGISKVVDNT